MTTTTVAPDWRDQLSAARFEATFLGLELGDARDYLVQDTALLRAQLNAERQEAERLRGRLTETEATLAACTREVAGLRQRLANAEATNRAAA